MTNLYKLKIRVHEWLADRFFWVQYPNLNGPTPELFRHRMPASIRIGLVLYAMCMLAVCAVALFFLGLLAYSVVKS